MATSTRRDYYEVLGVGHDAGENEIKRAYRSLAVRFHPDKNPDDPEAEEKFKEAAEAYAVLSDPEKRARFDRFGHQGLGAEGFTGFDADVFGDFADILGDIFGFGDLFGARRRSRSGGSRRGSDLQFAMSLSLEEAATGVERSIRVPRLEACQACEGSGVEPGTSPETCPSCNGRGQVAFRRGFLTVAQTCRRCGGQGRVVAHPCRECGGRGRVQQETTLEVKVPAGVDNGMRLRLTGEGESGVLGGRRGDLYVVVTIAPHEVFQRDGADLHMKLPVSVFKAMLGGRLTVPTVLGEERELEIAPGTQPGQAVRLRGAGMPALNGAGRGDLHVHFQVVVPRTLSEEQRSLVEEAAQVGGEDVMPEESLLQRLKRKLVNEA